MPDVHQLSTDFGTRPNPHRPTALVGRLGARQRLDDMISAARSGQGGSVLVRGEAGIGKSALLDYAESAATDFQVIKVSGSEFEQEMAYSALHQLGLPLLDRVSELPERHREALCVAFGLEEGTPDRFQIGLAALGVAAAAAQKQPLLCLVDDAQWLDSASSQAMLFLARRLGTDPIVMLFAARTPYATSELDELPALDVDGLSDNEAALLLETRNPFPLDEQVRNRLITEAHGNPLALLELPRAGGFVTPGTSSVPTRIERGFESRLAGVSAEARLLLIVASADPTGDSGLLWRAVDRLGVDLHASGAEATATGLAEFGTRIRFCHPLARSAVYRAARPDERQAAHRALAEATDPVTAPDRRAWHRAQAGSAPDDDIAAELEQSASRARARGGVAAAAAFLERSAELSLDGARRTARILAAAGAHFEAGSAETTDRLLATLEATPVNEFQRVRVDFLRGRLAFTRGDGLAGARLMVAATQRLAKLDPARARGGFLDALEMSLALDHPGDAVAEVLTAARSAAPPPSSPDPLETLLALAAKDYSAVVPVLRDLIPGDSTPACVRHPAISTTIAIELWNFDVYRRLADALVRAGRDSGSPSLLRFGLAQQAVAATMNGDVARASARIAEEEAVADASGAVSLLHHRLYLAALRGRREEALGLLEAATRRSRSRGAGPHSVIHWTAAVLYNGLADPASAMAAAVRAVGDGDTFRTGIALPELVEAAVRCGRLEVAAEALRSLTACTEVSRTPVALAFAAVARGLVTGEEDHYREGIERFADGPMVPYLGRAHLVYGEWLRGAGRRAEARTQLRTAYDLLSWAGAEGFARRAADGLLLVGDRIQAVTARPLEDLTMQEMAVARAVATGATSHEVANQLFISKRTVDSHLRNIFRKLGVSSRRDLRGYPELLS